MYILYIDESGDSYYWNEQNHFVLAGVAVHEGQVRNITSKLDEIQNKFFPDINIKLHLHAHPLRQGKGHFRKLDPTKREQLLDSIYSLMAGMDFPKMILFSTAMHINRVKSLDKVLDEVFMDMILRFDAFLRRQHARDIPNKGLLIIDKAHEEKYRTLLASFQQDGTKYGQIRNVIDVPYFGHGEHTRMLQLADFCAHAVFRYYNYEDFTLLKKILPNFDRKTRTSPPDGLKHLTSSFCECQACSWRNEIRM